MNLSTFKKLLLSCFLGSGFLPSVLFAQAQPAILPNGSMVANWTVPPFRASSAEGGLTTMTDISGGNAFVAMVPCRVFDTRNAVGPYGGPRLLANVTRNFDIDSGPCSGIPPFAGAYSMSFGAILPDGSNSFITIWPTGQAQPVVSSINPIQGTVVANAAIVPAGTGGSISIFPNTGVHLYGDINGYFPVVYNEGTALDIEGSVSGGNMMFVGNFATSGNTHGIFALAGNQELDSAGIFGRTSPALSSVPTYFAAGVRGEGVFTGVLGIALYVSNALGGFGVAGSLLNESGSELAFGLLGSAVQPLPEPPCPNLTICGGPWGVFAGGSLGATGIKAFLDPHPSDPKLAIAYVSLEGPEAGTYFRGRARFQNGVARISVPEHFRIVTDPEGLTVQITPIGGMATVGVLRMDLNEIVVQSSRNLEFSYLVQGVRTNFKDVPPVRSAGDFMPRFANSKLPLWLSP
ncbi:MAG TPA: hypothetical protein VFH13_00495, partial [Gemmatimonadaceae bacterium]|nr:hypothetical protein [Gemmatimonadaceae bacterium]